MAFRIKKDEAVAKAIRRLAQDRVEDALEQLRDCRRASAVHSVRKAIKAARAVLKLARPSIPKHVYRRQKQRLRKAANQLSCTRDAYVKGAALNQLLREFPGKLPAPVLVRVRRHLRAELKEEKERFDRRASVKRVKRCLKRVPRQVAKLKFHGKGWHLIAPAVERAYVQGLHGFYVVLRAPSPDHFHRWRKYAKELWHHLRLLRAVCPEQMGTMVHDLELLWDHLGDDHDLFLLQQSIVDLKANGPLLTLIGRRQQQLRQAALEIGARFYLATPSRFSRHLAKLWTRWRHG